jgi:hypothetical protein
MEDNAAAEKQFDSQPVDRHLENLRKQLEGEVPEGGKLEIRNIVTIVETAEQDSEGSASVGILTRYRGAATAALGLLSLGGEHIRESMNDGPLMTGESEEPAP